MSLRSWMATKKTPTRLPPDCLLFFSLFLSNVFSVFRSFLQENAKELEIFVGVRVLKKQKSLIGGYCVDGEDKTTQI